MKKILLFLSFLLMSISIWGAENDTHDFAQSINQSMNNCATFSDITIPEQSYPVKSVIITYAYNKSTNPTATVTIGSTNVGTQTFTGTGNLTTYKTLTFTPTSAIKGIVTISNAAGSSCSGSGKGTLKITNVRLVEGATGVLTTYTVTYEANGGTGTMTDPNSPYSSGATVTTLTNTFTRDGYTFTKWNTAANGGGSNYNVVLAFIVNDAPSL